MFDMELNHLGLEASNQLISSQVVQYYPQNIQFFVICIFQLKEIEEKLKQRRLDKEAEEREEQRAREKKRIQMSKEISETKRKFVFNSLILFQYFY